jgi:hypothetical protein
VLGPFPAQDLWAAIAGLQHAWDKNSAVGCMDRFSPRPILSGRLRPRKGAWRWWRCRFRRRNGSPLTRVDRRPSGWGGGAVWGIGVAENETGEAYTWRGKNLGEVVVVGLNRVWIHHTSGGWRERGAQGSRQLAVWRRGRGGWPVERPSFTVLFSI